MSLEVQPLGRTLLLMGLLLSALGAVLLWGPKVPWLGRLPGDIAIRRGHFSCYFPLATSVLLSAILSAGLWLISRFRP